jgi:hypothetical protein
MRTRRIEAVDLLIDADAQAQEAVFFAVVLRRRGPAQPRSRPAVLPHHQHLLRMRHRKAPQPGPARRWAAPAIFEDSPPDLPQIVIGRAVTREGIPVSCWVWPGNTADVAVLPDVKDDLRAWRLGPVVTAVDRGFSSRSNLDCLRRAGGHWIADDGMGDGNTQAALSRQGRCRQVRDNLRVASWSETAEHDGDPSWLGRRSAPATTQRRARAA